MDDTAWWGMGWLDAARHEVTVRHDVSDADRYLSLAEADASYIYSRPRPCHTQGIEWQVDYPADAIANEEFVAYAAQLSAPSPARREPSQSADLSHRRPTRQLTTRMCCPY